MGANFRFRVSATAAGTVLTVLLSMPVTGNAAADVAVPSDPCPAAMPVGELSEGMAASGLTVERGTAADEFSAEFVGVIDDGIAPGMDMIIMDTDSPAIQRAGGIWAGMSGSPVYAEDGRLIGAVAYGLSLSPSSIAGLVPAEHMLELLNRPGAATMSADDTERASVPRSMRREMVASGSASSAQAEDGMRRLPLPVAVSGLTSSRIDTFAERVTKRVPDARVHAAAGTSGVSSTPADIFPGSNFAAALSYGDLTAAGVGTTTAVCGGSTALAFGHPFLWSGRSSMSVHPASAVYVQRDNTLGSYKVANPLGVVGTLDQDRLAGIRGQLGDGPATVPVTSTVRSTDGASRNGTTQVAFADELPWLAAMHLLANQDRVADFIGEGSSRVRWIIDGTRASGEPFRIGVANRYADRWDISFESLWDSLNQLDRIQNNRFERVKITGVDYDVTMSDEFKRYTVGKVFLKRPNGTLVRMYRDRTVRVPAGSRLNLRVVLNQHLNEGPRRRVDLTVTVPVRSAGGVGRVNVIGGPLYGGGGGVSNFDELLTKLRLLPRNHALNAVLSLDTSSGYKQRRARTLVDQVAGGRFSFPIRVVASR